MSRYTPAAVKRFALYVGIGFLVLACGGGAFAAWMLRVEDIPEELPPVATDPRELTIPAIVDGQADLVAAQHKGHTVFFVVMGYQSMQSGEGRRLNRALNRWSYPETTTGFIIGDAAGFGFMRERLREPMGFFADEIRFPLYADFEGEVSRSFSLPKGHHGFAILGPDGEVIYRRSGGAEGEELDKIRELLGGVEPDPGPPAPEFEVGDLRPDDCKAQACLIAFVGESITRGDIPGVEGGFDPDDEEAMRKHMMRPGVRIVSTLTRLKLTDARGAVVGPVTDVELETFDLITAAPNARKAFGLDEAASAIVIVDKEGRLAFKEEGVIPMYRWGDVADLAGVEFEDRDD